jgi:hypothetical protein
VNKTQPRILVLVITMLLLFSPSPQVKAMLQIHFDQKDLSGALHTFHGDHQAGEQLPSESCVYCHLNTQATSFRNTMASFGITCSTCHGRMTVFNEPGQITYSSLPTCDTCHHPLITASTGVEIGVPMTLTDGSSDIQTGPLSKHPHNGSPMGVSSAFMDCSACHTHHQAAAFWHFGMEQ